MERESGATSGLAPAPGPAARLARIRPPALLVLLGTVVAGLGLSQLWLDPEPASVQLIKVGVPIALSLPVFYIAAMVVDSPRAGERQMHTVALGVVFAATAVAVITLVLWAEMPRTVGLGSVYFPLVMGVGAGASVGCAAGVIYDEWRATKAELATEVERTQRLNQRLRVVNRLLRHNVRNALNIAMAKLEEVQRGIDDPDLAARARECHDALDDLHRQAEKTNYINKLEDVSPGETTLDICDVVTSELQSWNESMDAITVRCDCEDAARIRAHPLARVAVRETIDNAVQHNSPEGLVVEGSVTTEEGQVRVTIADNGQGISESEVAPLEIDAETALEHSSGIGLWLVKWITEASDGDLALPERDDGVTVQLTFRRA